MVSLAASPYCTFNPNDSNCRNNPQYKGGYNQNNTILGINTTLPSSGGIGLPTIYANGGSIVGSNGNIVPNTTVNSGGFTLNNTTLDKIIAGITSGMAILKGAAYVPTTIQPQQQPIIYAGGGLGTGLDGGSGGSVLGKAEMWIQRNKGAAAIIGLVGAVAVLSATRSKSGRR